MRPPISCPRTVNCTNESVVIALHHMHDDSCRPVRPAPRQNCSRAQYTFGAPSFCLLSPVFGHIRQPTNKSRNLYQNQRNYNIACAACQRTIRRRCRFCKVSVTIHGILGVTSRPPFDKRSEYGEIFTIAYISVCPRPATVLIVTFHDILVESCCDFFKQILPRGLNGFYYG